MTQALSLSLRQRTVPAAPPDLAPFLGGQRRADPGDGMVETLLLLGANDGRGLVGIQSRARDNALPLPSQAAPVDLVSWSFSGRARELERPSPPRSRMVALAAALPMALAPARLAAQEETPSSGEELHPAESTSAPQSEAAPETRKKLDLKVQRARKRRDAPNKIPPWLQDTAPPTGKSERSVGAGLTISGSISLAVGFLIAGAMSSGYAFTSPGSYLSPSYAGVFAPLLIGGWTALGIGIPLSVMGTVRADDYKDWQYFHQPPQLRLSTGPKKGGWSGQLSLRF